MAKTEVSERAQRYLSRRPRPTLDDAAAFVAEPREVQVEVLAELRARTVGDAWWGVLGVIAIVAGIVGAQFSGALDGRDPLRGSIVVLAVVAVAVIGLIVRVALSQDARRRSAAWLGALEDELRGVPTAASAEPTPAGATSDRGRPSAAAAPVPPTPAAGEERTSAEPPAAGHRAEPDPATGENAIVGESGEAHPGRHRGGPGTRSRRARD